MLVAALALVSAADSGRRAIVASNVDTWNDLSSEQLMHSGMFGPSPCATVDIAGFDYVKEFANFCKKFGKIYRANTYNLRFAMFKASENCIKYKNSNHPTGSFFLRESHLADHTADELAASLGTKAMPTPPRFQQAAVTVESGARDPASGTAFDWRTRGALTPVGYQRTCGNCWAWCAKTVVESAWKIAGNNLKAVSVQQITDCSDATYCNGCSGGVPGEALRSVKSAGGICAEATYPYQGRQTTCNTKCAKVVAISDVKTNYAPQNEMDLIELLKTGPVAVALYASPDSFMSYGGGVYDDPKCNEPAGKINHGMVIVGYGTDAKYGDYWTLKNSWAASWGEQGYMRIKRGKNQCKIVSQWAQATSALASTFGINDGPSAGPLTPVAPLSPCQKTVGGVITRGLCQDVISCRDNGGAPTAGLCPGAANIQCCLNQAATTPTTPVTPPAPARACVAVHPVSKQRLAGTCIDEAICVATRKSPVAGACPGAANIKCCL